MVTNALRLRLSLSNPMTQVSFQLTIDYKTWNSCFQLEYEIAQLILLITYKLFEMQY